jgi:transposase
MSQEQSSAEPAAKPHWTQTPEGRKRMAAIARKGPSSKRYDDKFREKVLAYIRAGHNAVEASAKFGPHNSAIYEWMKKVKIKTRQMSKPRPEKTGVEPDVKWAQNAHILARKLKQAVRERLMTGFDLEEVEIYATLLTKAILK